MKYKLIIIFLLLAIIGAGAWSSYKIFNPGSPDTSQIKAQFIKGGDFKLSMGDENFELSSLRDRVVVLYFGYTFCPDVCPTGLAVLRDALSKLGDDLINTQGVFITLDPERDTAKRVKDYASFFHTNIRGVTGTLTEIDTVAQKYAVYYKKVQLQGSALGYSLDHSANFFVIDKDGTLSYVLDHSIDSNVLANTVKKLL
jgi:protein SCO1